MTIFQIIKNLKNYEITCKRNGHKPTKDDLQDFLNNTKFPKTTQCEECGFMLELKLDENDEDYYWTNEI